MFLEAHFGDVTRPSTHNHEGEGDDDDLLAMKVSVDGAVATVDLISMKVASESDELRERIEAVLEMALTTMTPLSRLYAGQGLEEVKEEVSAAA